MGQPTPELVGRTIAGKYRIEQLIGSGAMGAVYRARQIALEKTVAIKVLHREHADDALFAARFHREAKAASRLNHPNSVQVLDFGEDEGGLLYIAMEYLDGRSLHRVIRDERPLPPGRIADILMQVAAALAVAHDMGVVHRDLKPENIVVLRSTDDDGRPRDVVKVCDFGIAKITEARAYDGGGPPDTGAQTTGGFLVGTPEYMSPEQGRGEKLDPRSDLYSLGVILFEMLTGHAPFDAESAIGVLLRHVSEAPPRPSSLVPGVDPRLEAICLRALSKRREDRHQSARELRADLRQVLDPGQAVPSGGELPTVVNTADPATGHAPTLALPVRALPAPAASSPEATKPTLAGTTRATTSPASSRRALAVVAVAAALAGLGGTVVALRPGTSTAAAPRATAAPETTLVPEPIVGAEVPPLEPAAPDPSASAEGPRRGAAAAHPPADAGGKAKPAASAPPGPVAAAAVTAAAPPAPAPAAPPAAAEPEPPFEPSRAYAEVGLINAQGVRERAVRAALHGAGFSACYKQALAGRGARATGTITVDLSIDEAGAVRSAIASGGDFLPGLARCVQGAAAGVSVPRSQVEGGGGTAEVTLAFHIP